MIASRFLSHGVGHCHMTRCRSTSGLEEVKEVEQLRLKSHSSSADARIALLAPTKLVLMVKRLRAAFHLVILPYLACGHSLSAGSAALATTRF